MIRPDPCPACGNILKQVDDKIWCIDRYCGLVGKAVKSITSSNSVTIEYPVERLLGLD